MQTCRETEISEVVRGRIGMRRLCFAYTSVFTVGLVLPEHE